MNALIEKSDIDKLREKAHVLIDWLHSNAGSNIKQFEEKANQYAILTVKIYNYNKNNML